jgi:hypothetical protein
VAGLARGGFSDSRQRLKDDFFAMQQNVINNTIKFVLTS